MRYALLSDIHANHVALEAVMNVLKRHHFHRTIILGDLVGYATGCNESIQILRDLKGKKVFVRGNHDKVAARLESGAYFNITALSAIAWTREHLTEENMSFLKSLPKGPVELSGDLLISHGSPIDEDEYIFTDYDAYRVFMAYPHRIILHGHTHIPVVFSLNEDGLRLTLVRSASFRLKLDPQTRYLINPGSIGQPRDRNPMASFAVLDDKRNTYTMERVPYDVEAARTMILKAGLPHNLANRLREGS